MKIFARLVLAALALIAFAVFCFAINVIFGMHAHARYTGTISGLRLRAPVSILRDDRGVPHIIAQNDRDLFFAQGYVEGSDRLFQMDVLRRFVLGELAEVYGARALETDKKERAVPVRAMVLAQWRRLDARSRVLLGAFSDGVNAAIEREPLPVEFRILAYRPRPWTPQDSLAVAMVTVLDLIDDWNAIASRDAAFRRGGLPLLAARFPLTDPCYDAPVMAGLAGMRPGPNCKRHVAMLLRELGDARPPIGSNEWAAGANRTSHARALLANDPHLALQMPGVWYLVDLRAPGYHVAGAALPGCPTVVLGHNESVAWGATDGSVTSLAVFRPPAQLDPAGWQTERFAVRLAFGRYGKVLSDRPRVRHHDDPRRLRPRPLECVRPSRLSPRNVRQSRSREIDRRCDRHPLDVPRSNAKLRARRYQRPSRVRSRRSDPKRPRSRSLDSSRKRPQQTLSPDPIRALTEGGGFAEHDRVDGQQ